MSDFDKLKVSRVLSEDNEFVILEVMKHDTSTFHLQQDENGNTVGGDRFFTIIFVRNDGGKMKPWEPFEEQA